MGDARFRYWVMQNRYCDRKRCQCPPRQCLDHSDANVDVTQAGSFGSIGQSVGSLLLLHVGFFNKKTAVYEEAARNDLLPGGNEVKVESRGFGILNMLDGSTFVNGQKIPTVKLPVMLLHPDMTYVGPNLYTRRRPKYLDLDSTQVLHVKALGAKGDGKTDNTDTRNGICSVYCVWSLHHQKHPRDPDWFANGQPSISTDYGNSTTI